MLPLDQKFENKTKKLLKQGKKTAGAWLQAGSTITAEIMARAGFDWLIVDLEHGPGDIMLLIGQLQAMKGYGVEGFVRAPWNDFVTIKRILDAGVHGILVPYVNTKEEAEAAVKAMRYPTAGIRGVAGSPRAPGYGLGNANYLPLANDEVMLLVAMETPEAVANLDEILTVEGVDGIFIGPMDLATSMGHFCDPSHPEVKAAIATIEEKVQKSDKFLGTVAGNFDNAKEKYDKGYQFLILMSDATSLSALAHKTATQFKETFPGR